MLKGGFAYQIIYCNYTRDPTTKFAVPFYTFYFILPCPCKSIQRLANLMNFFVDYTGDNGDNKTHNDKQ